MTGRGVTAFAPCRFIALYQGVIRHSAAGRDSRNPDCAIAMRKAPPGSARVRSRNECTRSWRSLPRSSLRAAVPVVVGVLDRVLSSFEGWRYWMLREAPVEF